MDKTNEYKFPTSDTNKKPDRYFLLVKKIFLNYLIIDSSMIVRIGIKC